MGRSPRPATLALAAVALAAVARAVGAAAARDAAQASPGPGCGPAPGDGTAVVETVADDGDVRLKDGRVLRLAGLALPRATPASPDLPARTRAGLLAWASGPVTLHALAGADRWGRIPALLFRSETPRSAATALVEAGLARVAPEPAVHACAPALLAGEAAARAAGRGLWGDPAYAVLRPADAAGLAAQAGGMALVEGILRVHDSRGALYLALGPEHRGFEAVVTRRDAKAFARAGLDLRDYADTPVRLRGDLDARFGPRLRLTDPDAMESLEPGSLAGEP